MIGVGVYSYKDCIYTAVLLHGDTDAKWGDFLKQQSQTSQEPGLWLWLSFFVIGFACTITPNLIFGDLRTSQLCKWTLRANWHYTFFWLDQLGAIKVQGCFLSYMFLSVLWKRNIPSCQLNWKWMHCVGRGIRDIPKAKCCFKGCSYC